MPNDQSNHTSGLDTTSLCKTKNIKFMSHITRKMLNITFVSNVEILLTNDIVTQTNLLISHL